MCTQEDLKKRTKRSIQNRGVGATILIISLFSQLTNSRSGGVDGQLNIASLFSVSFVLIVPMQI